MALEAPAVSDHDLIIEIKTLLRGLTEEVRLMRDDTKVDVKELKDKKVDRLEFLEKAKDYQFAFNSIREDFQDDSKNLRNDMEKESVLVRTELKKVEDKSDFTVRVTYMVVGIGLILEIVAPFVLQKVF
jgi:hypothetical protein